MQAKRLTLFAGHYGSGKTNIALNYAYWLKEQGKAVTIADLDIVNPYFRVKDSEEMLRKDGIELISSRFANSNVDLPAMPKETYGLVADKSRWGVLDIGGDDRGALALGRYVPEILEEDNYEFLLVANRSRPLTRTPEDTVEVMWEIYEACGLRFTALVNNTNLGLETKLEDVLDSMDYIRRLSEITGLPVKMTCIRRELYEAAREKIPDLFPLELQRLYYMLNSEGTNGKADI